MQTCAHASSAFRDIGLRAQIGGLGGCRPAAFSWGFAETCRRATQHPTAEHRHLTGRL